MANLVHKTTIVADGDALVIEQYRNAPRFMAILNSFLVQIQALEDAAYALLVGRLIQNDPTGALLAQIGKLVGQSSMGLSDDQWRYLIKARIPANRSDGRRRTMIRIARLLTGNLPVYAQDYQPATFMMAPQGILPVSPRIMVTNFLGPALGGGVRLVFVYSFATPANTIIGGSVNTATFAAGPPVTGSGVTAAQSPGSVNFASFSAGPPVVHDGGGVGAGVIHW